MMHFEQIRAWAKERGLYDIQYQPLPQIGFLVEELHEFITATDDNGRIDALCDMTVFAVNAIGLLHKAPEKFDARIKYIYEEHGCATAKDLANKRNIECFMDIIEDLMKYIGGCCTHNHNPDNQVILIVFCRTAIEFLGYDYDKAMTETLKEINSRVGYFDEAKGKWVKTETKYKANYDLARIEE